MNNGEQQSKSTSTSSKIVDVFKVTSFSEAVEKFAYLIAGVIALGFLAMIVSLMGTGGLILLLVVIVIGAVLLWRLFK